MKLSRTGPAEWPQTLAILALLPQLCLCDHLLASATNTVALERLTSVPPDPSTILIKLDRENLSLSDQPDRVLQHFKSRPEDKFLTKNLSTVLHRKNSQRGIALREGRLQFGAFPAVVIASDLGWDENPVNDRNWAWRLHCLEHIQFLLAAHAQTQSAWFLDQCSRIIGDWAQDNYKQNPPSEFSWSDHSTALRLQNLLYALEYGRQEGLDDETLTTLIGLIHSHASILCHPALYQKHTNHGLDQSHVLYQTGAALPSFKDAVEWREVGRSRSLDELAFAFTSEGIHVENSPSYHLAMLRRALAIEEALHYYEGSAHTSDLTELVDEGFRFAAHVMRPDGTLPLLGDSQAQPARDHPSFQVLSGRPGYEAFRYCITRGQMGVRPNETFRIYPESGYAVMRSTWEPDQFSQSLHLVFKAGFLSTYHRHDDDLSFVLYNRGEDWIIDSGLVSYQEKDPIRQYARSARAHNVPVVANLTQGRSSDHLGQSRIIDHQIDGDTVAVRAGHKLYPGIEVTRLLTYAKPGTITLLDRIVAEMPTERTFQVLLHFPTDKVITLGENSATVRSLRNGTVMRIRALEGPITKVRQMIGQQSPVYQGWTSPTYGKVEPSVCLAFEGQGNSWESTLELTFELP